MPQVYQTYVTQISNNQDGEIPALLMLEEFSPIAAQMSKVALLGLQNQMKKDKLNTQLQQQFKVNKRHANSIINFVGGALASAQECHKAHIETLRAKIRATKKSIEDLNKRLKAHREYVQAVEKRNLAIKTREKTKAVKLKKVPDLKKKPEFDDACPINGQQYYGMTYLQMAKQKLHEKKRQLWMYIARQARVIKGGVNVNLGNLGSVPFIGSTGESNSNQICQLTPDVIPSLKIRVPYFLSEKFGEYVVLPLYKINPIGYDKVRSAWALNTALTYVFSKNKKGKWVVAITCNVDFFLKFKDSSKGCIGLDINPGSIGWCSTDRLALAYLTC